MLRLCTSPSHSTAPQGREEIQAVRGSRRPSGNQKLEPPESDGLHNPRVRRDGDTGCSGHGTLGAPCVPTSQAWGVGLVISTGAGETPPGSERKQHRSPLQIYSLALPVPRPRCQADMATSLSPAPVPILGDMNGQDLRLAWERWKSSLSTEPQSPSLSHGLRLTPPPRLCWVFHRGRAGRLAHTWLISLLMGRPRRVSGESTQPAGRCCPRERLTHATHPTVDVPAPVTPWGYGPERYVLSRPSLRMVGGQPSAQPVDLAPVCSSDNWRNLG